MARYTCLLTVNLLLSQFFTQLKAYLKNNNFETLLSKPECLVARETPGTVPFAKLVTIEVLADSTHLTENGLTAIELVAKNEELPLQSNNHCHQVFEQLSQVLSQFASQANQADTTDPESLASPKGQRQKLDPQPLAKLIPGNSKLPAQNLSNLDSGKNKKRTELPPQNQSFYSKTAPPVSPTNLPSPMPAKTETEVLSIKPVETTEIDPTQPKSENQAVSAKDSPTNQASKQPSSNLEELRRKRAESVANLEKLRQRRAESIANLEKIRRRRELAELQQKSANHSANPLDQAQSK
ncbi:MAG: hypothetical protein HC934_12005 [Acaryochloridaceae cyanobacterium SU_2_1]|nr:hypothetical protein [Acaryochloridaceae cyanobacterium SU_2_1]